MRLGFLVPALFIGLFMAIISALFSGTPAFFVGAAWYGLPANWLVKMAVAPQYNAWRIDAAAFLIDAVFWFVTATIVMLMREYPPRRMR